MSAVVCGKRSSFFEDHSVPSSSASPPASKRIRCSSSSPVRYSSTISTSSRFFALDRLIALFPDMDKQILERSLSECGDDMETAIKSLTQLRLGSDAADGEAVPVENSVPQKRPVDGADWVDLFVREMASASNMDDARTRASRALELLEKSLCEHVSNGLEQQENLMMKEQLQALVQENTLLKRAVAIQHERQKEFEDMGQEVHNLKQMVSQYQTQLTTLEVNNYSLSMHLKQAQQGNSIPGRFHPDVF